MRPLTRHELEEVENLAAEGDLDAELKLAHAAELRALRRLHNIARIEHRGSLRFIRLIESLPQVADVAAWKKLIEASREAQGALEGAEDLVSAARKPW